MKTARPLGSVWTIARGVFCNRSPGVVLLLLAGLLFPLWSGCAADSSASEARDVEGKNGAVVKEDEAVPIAAFPLQRGPIERVLRYSSNLEAERSVAVLAEASRKVTSLLVEEGSWVRKGQTLLLLEDQAQKTQLAKVESQLAKAEREYGRQKQLFAQAMISEQAFSDATYEKEQLQLAVDDAKRELGYVTVVAPISGTVTRRMVNLGDQVQVNGHLFDIVDFSSLVARIFVPEKELRGLSRGQRARLFAQALGDAPRDAKVLRIAPTVDSKSGTVKVTLAIPQKSGLRPGMFVEIDLIADTDDNALLVPKRALIYDEAQTFLFRVVDTKIVANPAASDQGDADQGDDRDGEPTAPETSQVAGDEGYDSEVSDGSPAEKSAEGVRTVERLLVEPTLESRNYVKVAGETLSVGDLVVVAGQAGLQDGAKVRLLDLQEAIDTFGGGADAAELAKSFE